MSHVETVARICFQMEGENLREQFSEQRSREERRPLARLSARFIVAASHIYYITEDRKQWQEWRISDKVIDGEISDIYSRAREMCVWGLEIPGHRVRHTPDSAPAAYLRPDAILTTMLSGLMQFAVSARIFSAVNYRLKWRCPYPFYVYSRCHARALNFRDPMRTPIPRTSLPMRGRPRDQRDSAHDCVLSLSLFLSFSGSIGKIDHCVFRGTEDGCN